MIALFSRRVESYAALRRRILRETEAALELGLRESACVPRIPTIEVGRGAFEPEFSRRFWEAVLEMGSETG